MTSMNPSGIEGCGMCPVLAKMPNAIVRMIENTAAGMFRSCAFAMDLCEWCEKIWSYEQKRER
jgi:hypothetical protein